MTKEFWRIEIKNLLTLMFLGFMIGKFISLNEIVKTFPIDTTAIIHVEKVVSPKISWASFYDYSITNIPMYSSTHATAASTKYPRGTILNVTGVDSGKSIEVRVNDYGPESCEKSNNYHGAGSADSCVEREIDLSSYAYKQICSIPKGLCKVIIKKI